MRSTGLIAACAAVLAMTLMAVVQTTLVGRVSAGVIATVTALGGMAGIAATAGLPRRGEIAALGRNGTIAAALSGAAGLAVAPILVMANRHTDAPSAGEVIFFTTAAWALVTVLAGVAFSRPRGAGVLLVSAVTATVAVALLVASWEFPSSFSPFVKFPRQDAALLLAGAGWAAFSVGLARVPATSRRAAAWVGATAALAVAVVAALSAPATIASSFVSTGTSLALYAVSAGVLVAGWFSVVGRFGAVRAGATLFLPPVLITVVSAAVGDAMGGQPMLLGRALAASALAVVAVAVLVVPTRGATARGWHRTALFGGALTLALAVAGLAVDTVWASVATLANSGADAYSAAWSLAGWESGGGWLAFCAAVALLAAARETWRPVVVGLASAMAYPVLRAVPLHTWTTWMPARVQQDFGTEYARLTFEAMPAAVQAGAVIAAALGLAAVGALRAGSSRRAEKEER